MSEVLSRFIDGGLRIIDREKLIERSGLFDADWYVAQYPEAGSRDKALAHFLKHSAKQGTDPGPGFCTRAYLSDHPDVAQSGMNPLLHYLRFGRFEGRMARDRQGRPSGEGADHGLNEAALARVKAAFDPRFYRDTNPDLPEETDAFAHFMGPGWRQMRDPADWFSVEKYLRDNADIAQQGQNPFAHYLVAGCREGRQMHASRRQRHTAGDRAKALKTGVVAMIRNEADIIRLFAGHVLALFDEIVIVDHRSNDGTEDFLASLAAQYAQVTLLHLDDPSYIQSVTMTHVLRHMPQLASVDWVFFLDADEFLPFPDRGAFHAALAEYARCPVIAMHWRNLIPTRYWPGSVTIDEDTTFLVPPTASPFRKIALQPDRVPLSRIVVAQGNHSLIETVNGLELPDFDVDFPIFHVPVRSADQILLKLNQGVLAYQKIGPTRDAGQGTHWYQMKEATASTTLSKDHLNAMAMNYSEPKDGLSPVSHDGLAKLGYVTDRICPAQVPFSVPDVALRPIGESLIRIYGEDYADGASDDTPGTTCLALHGSRLCRLDERREYAALPASRKEDGPADLTCALNRLMQASYQEIEDLTPSDWCGHVPFMFALTGLLQPRRFVDIGTLRGTGFFACMQIAKDIDCEGIAISPWAVEESRAAEFASVFEDFQFLARKYADKAAMLRLQAPEALSRFDDGSIDLLHIDGLSRYEDATSMVDAWLPKLSDRGVLLMHDVHAYHGEFGVWRLWDEMAGSYPCIDLRHDQGLGMACVGEAVPSSLREIAVAFRKDADLRTLLQQHFEALGRLSAELFARRYDMAQLEMRGAAEGAQTEEISWLQQELAAVRAEAEDLREMVKGGLRRVAE